jgi:hypothetical protein
MSAEPTKLGAVAEEIVDSGEAFWVESRGREGGDPSAPSGFEDVLEQLSRHQSEPIKLVIVSDEKGGCRLEFV